MFLIIVGTGAMGRVTRECAEEDGAFERIAAVDPRKGNWPQEKADLIIDFSHPDAMQGIYEYCRDQGGGIPVVLGTTGQGPEDERLIALLEKICPIDRRSNYSRGIAAVEKLAALAAEQLAGCDLAVEEIHHTKKKDAPSGTAKTLCSILGLPATSALSLRLGTVPGEHRLLFALEDEVVEIRHVAFSKRIFARGAIEAGKALAGRADTEKID